MEKFESDQVDEQSYHSQKPLIYAIALLIIVAAVAGASWMIYQKFGRQDVTETPPLLPGLTYMPTNQLPEGISEQMVLVPDATIIESYEYDKEGKRQATVRFSTALSPAEVSDEYTVYLADNGWQVQSNEAAGDGSLFYLSAVREQSAKTEYLYLTAQLDASTGTTVVDLTLVRDL